MKQQTPIPTVELMRSDVGALIHELRRAGMIDANETKNFRCVWHDDKKPSAGIWQNPQGIYRFRCHACNVSLDYWDVRAKNEKRTVEDLIAEVAREERATDTTAAPPKPAPKTYPDADAVRSSFKDRMAAAYAYTDPDTRNVDILVIRTKDKQFFQFHQVEGGAFVTGAPEKPWPIYNRSRLRESDLVVVTEGEKDVHTLHQIGVAGTTSPAGAGKAAYADWTPLAGKQVILWPDNDDPGRKHMADVRRILESLKPLPQISIIDPVLLDIQPKGDVSDFLSFYPEDQWAATFNDAITTRKIVGPSGDLRQQFSDIITGKRFCVPMCHPITSRLSQALLPATVTVFCGSPGASKSFMVQEILMRMHFAGVPVALFHLEDNRTFHLRRALAQLAGVSDVTDEAWVKANPATVLGLEERYRDQLDSFGSCITISPGQTATYSEVIAWCEAASKAGARVLAVDPITLADPGRKRPYEADRELTSGIKAVVEAYQNSLILVSHPKKSDGYVAKAKSNDDFLNQLAGGAAMQRFIHVILWLEYLMDPMPNPIVSTGSWTGAPGKPVNRILHIAKARNGKGGGAAIAYHFDPDTLRLVELGVLSRKKK